ncbi:MAG TPA: hypothetical protein VF794_36405 [Archangium sp.]|jgi:hypothetical protein|uniref:hypothetical protein n=1 Tax=Archangium sp. TaxID=1872627 RepID=UPI002ED93C43
MRSSIARLLGGALGVSLLGLVLTAGAQEDEGKDEAGRQSLRLQTPKEDLKAQVTSEAVTGTDIQLTRKGDTVRGLASGSSVSLNRKGGKLEGIVGGQSVRITSKSDEEGIVRLEGTFGGGPLELDITPDELAGTVGTCTYDLQYEDEAYQGVRTCGENKREHVWVFVTPGIPAEVSPLLATTLVVLLGSEVSR